MPLCSLICAVSYSQSDFSGLRRYPQFRTFSGLPGGGYAVTPNGDFSINGALSFSTPISYGLGHMTFVGGLGNASDSRTPRFFDRHDQNSNGTGWISGGMTTKFGQLSGSYMVLSSKGDQAYNLQLTLPFVRQNTHFAIGVQDATSIGGASGETIDNTNNLTSRSYYVVGTHQLKDGKSFVSLGLGDRRFGGLFGNASTMITNNVRGTLEYDTFNWNLGATTQFGIAGHPVQAFLGLAAGKYATWGLSTKF